MTYPYEFSKNGIAASISGTGMLTYGQVGGVSASIQIPEITWTALTDQGFLPEGEGWHQYIVINKLEGINDANASLARNNFFEQPAPTFFRSNNAPFMGMPATIRLMVE